MYRPTLRHGMRPSQYTLACCHHHHHLGIGLIFELKTFNRSVTLRPRKHQALYTVLPRAWPTVYSYPRLHSRRQAGYAVRGHSIQECVITFRLNKCATSSRAGFTIVQIRSKTKVRSKKYISLILFIKSSIVSHRSACNRTSAARQTLYRAYIVNENCISLLRV